MTTTYDIVRPEYVWLVDGQPTVGDYNDYRTDLASNEAVRGLWRVDVHILDGDDVSPVLVYVNNLK